VEFWTALLTKAQEFFLKVSLPELVACHYTRAASTTQLPLTMSQQAHSKRPRTQALQKTNQLWCVCRGPEDQDDMVACDKENSAIE